MKVIHEKKVSERIHEACREAEANKREIRRIELTPDEFDRLERELENPMDLHWPTPMLMTLRPFSVRGHRYRQFNGVHVQDYEGEG